MKNHSLAYTEFEKNVSNLRRLSHGLRYIMSTKEQYVEWLEKETGKKFSEDDFNQELMDTITKEIEVSNVLLRTYVERFCYDTCGKWKTFIKQYKREIDSCKMEYQRQCPQLSVLDINRDLRHSSVHYKLGYDSIVSSKKPSKILSEPVMLITNNKAEKQIVLLHDLNKVEIKSLLDEAHEKMSVTNISNHSLMGYGEILREEVLSCIRQIDLKRESNSTNRCGVA